MAGSTRTYTSGVTEEPEQVLPQQWLAAAVGDEEVGAEHTVEDHHGQG